MKRELITTVSVFRDVSTAGSTDWVEPIPIVQGARYIRVNGVLGGTSDGTADYDLHFLWSDLPIPNPNGILIPFFANNNAAPMTADHSLASPVNINNIRFRIASRGLGKFVNSITDTQLAFSISFYK